MEAKAVWNMSTICQETGESSEAINYAELASRICSGVQIDDDIKKLAEEIKGWMIKRVGDRIKNSGL